MAYINVNTLEELTSSEIIRNHPYVSFPNSAWTDELLAPFGYAELHFPVTHPIPKKYQKLVSIAPVKIDNKWTIQFELQDIIFESEDKKLIFIEEWKNELKSKATSIRYSQETAGIIFEDKLFKTDRESQSLINSTYNAFKSDLITSVNWKVSNGGEWITFNKSKFEELTKMIFDHIQNCFNKEMEEYNKINTCSTIDELKLL